MKSYFYSILLNAVVLPFIHGKDYSNVFIKKLNASIILSVFTSPLMYLIVLIKRYILTDANFVEILGVCLTCELIAGIWKHLKLCDFHGRKLALGFMEKVLVAFLGMIVFNAVGHMAGMQDNPTMFKWLSFVGQLVIIFYVIGSIANSLFVITNGKFPPIAWIKRMAQFSSTGDAKSMIEDLKNNIPVTQTQ